MRMSNTVKMIFDSHNSSYEDFRNVLKDTGMRKVNPKFGNFEQANEIIRNIQFEILGVNPDCSRSEFRKAFRRNKIAVYEVIEDTLEDMLVSGWGDNPFFMEFVEQKYYNLGDRNEFYTPDDVILTVSEIAGNHHDLLRQRLGEGSTFTVKTSWYGVR